EVCALLFFRFGITPTANKLYQVVKKGSMSAPAEALSRFWKELREKSRIRIENPALPEELRVAAGILTGKLWDQAQVLAHESLNSFRAETLELVHKAQVDKDAAYAERDGAINALSSANGRIDQLNESVSTLEKQLAGEQAIRSSLETQLSQAAREIEGLKRDLTAARQDFSAELAKLNSAAKLAEERYLASEQRALLEIDRERTMAGRLEKELAQSRVKRVEMFELHKTEITSLQHAVGQYRQQIGVLEGNLEAAKADRNRLEEKATTMRTQFIEIRSQLAAHEVQSENWREKYEAVIAENAKLANLERRGRKPKLGLRSETRRSMTIPTSKK
ncbi:MAG TPA: DNA-binding protein, partial [Gallionella sp.]|nr:DNA-binding protein [Gallionella sp.]